MLTMKKRIKLEFFDRSGVKHSLAIEGDFTTDKVTRLLEYAEIVAGSASHAPNSQGYESKMDRLLDVISTQGAEHAFDSRQICQSYRETWGGDFALGAVSTYLSRLADRGMLERTGSPAHWFYRVKASQAVPP
jgi:hypothetical protein